MSTTFNMESMFRKCAICGEDLPVRDTKKYLYKGVINRKAAYFCSYKCFRIYEKEKENGRSDQQERGNQ